MCKYLHVQQLLIVYNHFTFKLFFGHVGAHLAAADVATDATAELKLGDTVKWSSIPLKFYPCELSAAAQEALTKACDALAPAAPLSRDAVEGLVARLVSMQYYVLLVI
jgi:hypothetical protein